MENLKECPVCGSKEMRQGKQVGHARMFPIIESTTLLKGGSNIIAIICSDCGQILSMKVENPENFK